MKNLSEKETAAIAALRERLKDLEPELDDFHKHEYTLLRFLTARELNVEKAELMFRKNHQWRKDNKVDAIMSTDLSEDIMNRFPVKFSGYDEEGCHIFIVPVGRNDYRYVVENNKKDEFHQYMLKLNELCYEFWKYKSTPGNFVHKHIGIVDYEGFSFKQFASPSTLQFLKEAMAEGQENYPEVVKVVVIVNAPKLFAVIYNFFKLLLTKTMMEKMQIYGSNADEWRQAIRTLAPPDQIPSQYGGSNTTCFNYHFDMGLDLTPQLVTLDEKDMKRETLGAGQQLTIDLQAPTAGTLLNWNFKTDDYDVGFYVYFESISPESEIVSCPRCDSHINIQKGSLPCDKPGKYVLCFDNSYSKFRSKTMYYVTQIVPPTKNNDSG